MDVWSSHQDKQMKSHHKILKSPRFQQEHKQTHTGTCAGTRVINQQATKT